MIKLPAVAEDLRRRRAKTLPAPPDSVGPTESQRPFRRPFRPTKLSLMKRKTNSMPLLSLEMPYEAHVMQPTRSSMTDRQRTILEEYTPRLSLNFEKVFRESGIAERVKPLSARTVAEDQFRSKSLFDEIDLVTSMTFGDKLTVTSLEKAFAVLEKLGVSSPKYQEVIVHIINIFRRATFSDFYTTDESGGIVLVPYYEIAMSMEEEKDLLKESEITLRENVETLTRNLDKMETMNEQYKTLLAHKESEMEELQGAIKDSDKELSALRLENARLQEKLDMQTFNSNDLGVRVSDLSEKLLAQDKELERLRAENGKISSALESTKARLESESSKLLEVSAETIETRKRIEENHARELKALGRQLMDKERAFDRLEKDLLAIEKRSKDVGNEKLELETRQRSMTPRPDWKKLKQHAPMLIRPDVKSTRDIVRSLCEEIDNRNYYAPLQKLVDSQSGKSAETSEPEDEMLNFIGGVNRKYKAGEVDMYVAAVKRKQELKKSKR